MSEARRKFEAPSRPTDTQRQCPTTGGSKPRSNRLSRSFRQTQQTQAQAASPKTQQPEFKTPSRVPRSRYVGGFTAESPHNEPEFHHDIVWDATSPSPVRAGKRGKTRSVNAGVVDIAEIVSRIAPKHGRPAVIEPTLQQWIGDSATIPCTPDVQLPKPKKKSPRPNGVDDLLKLAKQFDLNMFHHDEEEAEEMHQQSLELLSEDILDLESGDDYKLPPVPTETSQPAVNTATVRDSQANLPLDLHMEDDLDFLFDGPTQHLSGNLSQISVAPSSNAKPAPPPISQAASGKDSAPLRGPIPSFSTKHSKASEVDNIFEDDWGNDDLLNDSLLLEMTQNPKSFATPKHCSTQRGSREIQYQRNNAVNIPANAVQHQPENRHVPSAVSKAAKENVKHRMTFKLEANTNFPFRGILTDASAISNSDGNTCAGRKVAQPGQSSFSKDLSIESGSRFNWKSHHSNIKSNPQEAVCPQRTSIPNSSAKLNTCASTSSCTSNVKATTSYPMKPSPTEGISNHKPPERREVPAPPVPSRNSDFLDDDLDSFFMSDSGWSDQEDDDLLCEMCEDMESQVQSVENYSSKNTPLPIGHPVNQRPALAPSSRVWDSRNQQTQVKMEPFKHVPTNPQSSGGGGTCGPSFSKNLTPASLLPGSSRPAGQSFAGTYASKGTAHLQSNTGKESHKHTQASSTSRIGTLTNQQWSAIQSAAASSLGNTAKHQNQFTFKRSHNPVTTVTNKGFPAAPTGKCSAAEIELKKQQAMERRRLRIQANQNLRAPT
ncbi:ewing's tumor-associated antigen 1 [Myripristis murdjan]|uniref:ewing's tumor-associated antigen 1 n=1 Tax=Myripristis murdjan TaxID=586833 RepID=UPI001176168A|nr:ewing's tumor-associated antigen 1 homolog [Myripristis murdjan]